VPFPFRVGVGVTRIFPRAQFINFLWLPGLGMAPQDTRDSLQWADRVTADEPPYIGPASSTWGIACQDAWCGLLAQVCSLCSSSLCLGMELLFVQTT
jgi:hypothetical protein